MADVVNPDYLKESCPIGTIEKRCYYSTYHDPYDFNGCRWSLENPTCFYLDGDGKGTNRYCCEAGIRSTIFSGRLSFVLLLTLLMELTIFWIFGFRKRREIIVITIANIISVYAFFIASSAIYGINFVIYGEILIIIFEILFLKIFLRDIEIKRISLIVLIANLISAILGFGIFSFINYLVS